MQAYLVTRQSKRELVRVRHGWGFPVGKQWYRSLRHARVWAKRNAGTMNVEFTVKLPGQIRSTEIKGKFSLDDL